MLAVCGRRRLFVRRAADRTACSMILAAEAPSLAAAWGMGTPEPRERISAQQQLGPAACLRWQPRRKPPDAPVEDGPCVPTPFQPPFSKACLIMVLHTQTH